MNYRERYKQLNTRQKQAVDTIDGPLLVIAGPGTGKTELLSMRTATILDRTDTLPENILLLTFTDSGANAMRERLASIIGPDAYRVAIHTFHSFGSEIINQHREYFYNGASLQPADEITSREILTKIFDELDYANVLAAKHNGKYAHLEDALRTISELKNSGLTSDELVTILDANQAVLDAVEADLSEVFQAKISTTMLASLVPLAERVAALAQPSLPPGITPLSNILALSMAHAFDEAVQTGKTNAITVWRNQWMEKNHDGIQVFKDRKRITKLRAISYIYYLYLTRMTEASLYDYDDMILNVVHALETHDDLRYNLQERYQYILVDEFQDTNLAQLRILFDLTNNPAHEGRPNIMAVGDDDQAIYSFQGADINNIHRFRDQYPAHEIVVLTDNYRSGQAVLSQARSVILQGQGRLEETIDFVDKTLTPHSGEASVALWQFDTPLDERAWIARDIQEQLQRGVAPESITVLARRHQELIALVPYLERLGIAINYERRDNVLENEAVRLLFLMSAILTALWGDDNSVADSLLPELLSQPIYNFSAEAIWRLSLGAHRNNQRLFEAMLLTPEFTPLATWLLELRKLADSAYLEQMLDTLIGAPDTPVIASFRSPLYDYYFSPERLAGEPSRYLEYLEAIRTIRAKLRDYSASEILYIQDFLDFVRLYEELGSSITTLRRHSDKLGGSVNLMTAHKSKGLEFDHVYIMNAVDSVWGERVRTRSRLIGYPENLQIAPAGDSYDERLRLFFVAMTRAKKQLSISYSTSDEVGKSTLLASFLADDTLSVQIPATPSIEHETQVLTTDWRSLHTAPPTASMRELLAPTLETYKLSATHLGTFIDVTRGGPANFLMRNLLRFPQAKSPEASYGTAVHATLQRAHNTFTANGIRRPVEDILHDFEHELERQHLQPDDEKQFTKRGIDALTKFLEVEYGNFSRTQKTELGFGEQGVVLDGAKLTGSLDLVTINDKSIRVVDYKTGAPSREWRGSTEYEKIKLHKYRQQLMFYQLLIEHSRDFAKYTFDGAVLQFVEPDRQGKLHRLETSFSTDELVYFQQLIVAVWRRITALDLPDISTYDQSLRGIEQFEQDIIDNNI